VLLSQPAAYPAHHAVRSTAVQLPSFWCSGLLRLQFIHASPSRGVSATGNLVALRSSLAQREKEPRPSGPARRRVIGLRRVMPSRVLNPGRQGWGTSVHASSRRSPGRAELGFRPGADCLPMVVGGAITVHKCEWALRLGHQGQRPSKASVEQHVCRNYPAQFTRAAVSVIRGRGTRYLIRGRWAGSIHGGGMHRTRPSRRWSSHWPSRWWW
jgi:hypothetical protein